MSNNPVSFTDPDGGWDGDSGMLDDPFGRGLYANSTSANNPDAYAKSEFDRKYNKSGPWGGSIGADGSFTSNESWIAGAHTNWKASQSQNNDYFETNVHFDKDGGLVGFSGATIVGYRSDMMYDYVSQKGKAREQSFWDKLDRAMGEGLFGKAGYDAVKKNGGNNNPYMFTNDELRHAAEIEMEILASFIPVGKVFQGVKWGGGIIAKYSIPILTKANKGALGFTAKVISKTLNKGKNSVFIKQLEKMATRFDLLGKAHGGVPTPHKQLYKYNVNPLNGAENFSRASKFAEPMGWKDMGTVIAHLMGF